MSTHVLSSWRGEVVTAAPDRMTAAVVTAPSQWQLVSVGVTELRVRRVAVPAAPSPQHCTTAPSPKRRPHSGVPVLPTLDHHLCMQQLSQQHQTCNTLPATLLLQRHPCSSSIRAPSLQRRACSAVPVALPMMTHVPQPRATHRASVGLKLLPNWPRRNE